MRHYYEDDEPDRRYRSEGGYYDRRRGQPERGEGPRREERGFVDRAADEVRSWFGDEEAQRRRRHEREEGGWRSEGERGGEERSWARQWGYVDPRETRGGGWGERSEPRWTERGPAEWRAPGERGSADRGYGERGYADRGSADRGSADRGYTERGYADRGGGDWGEWRGWAQERSGASAPWYGGAASPERFWGERRPDTTTWRSHGEGRGPHAGRGPRSYQRKDERILEDVCERLAQDPDIDATDIEVSVDNGEVTLGGRVNSRYEKRLAEDLAETVWGIREVRNTIRVASRERGDTGAEDRPPQPGQSWPSRAA